MLETPLDEAALGETQINEETPDSAAVHYHANVQQWAYMNKYKENTKLGLIPNNIGIILCKTIQRMIKTQKQ